jgi:hypothetical protein
MTAARDLMTPEQWAHVENQDRGHGRWSQTDMILALIADRVAQQTHILGQWKTPPPWPEPIPRPGINGKRGRPQNLADLKANVPAETFAWAERLKAQHARQERPGQA